MLHIGKSKRAARIGASLTVALLMVGAAVGIAGATPTPVVDHIKIAPSTQSIVAGQTSGAYTARAYDSYGNHWDVTAGTSFSIDVGSCDNTAKTCTSTLAGNRTVTGTYDGVTDTAKLKVTPAALDHITVKPNKTTITAGETSGAYSSTAYDAYGNHWDVTSDTTFSIDDGSCDNTAKTCTSTLAGNRTVTGIYEGMTDTAILKVDPAALDHIVVKPNKVTITAGDSASYTAKGYDAYGNHWDITADTTFTVDGGSCAGATCTSTDAGSHTVTGTYDGMTDTAILKVDPAALDHIVVKPNKVTITAGDSASYTAKGYDAYGNHWDITADTTFSIDDGSCDNTAKTCTSTLAGNRTVTGTYEGMTDTAKMEVDAGPVDHIVVSPATQTITAGETSGAYSAEAYDAYGNHWDVTADTTFSIDDGSCDNSAKTCTSTLAGDRTVTGAYGMTYGDVSPAIVQVGYTDTAILTVTAGPLAKIAISPDPKTIAAGTTTTYSAEGFDQYGNSRGDVTSNTTFTITTGGTCTGTGCGSSTADTYTVTGTVNGTSISAGATLVVVANTGVSSIAISPKAATIAAGGSQPYTATSLDQYGNPIGDVTADTVFTIAGGGSCTGAVCTSTVATTHNVTGIYLGMTDTAVLTVGFAGPSALVISPNPVTIGVGQTQTFTAAMYDAYGNFVADVTADTIFTIDGAGKCEANVCGSAVAGTYTVTGTFSGTAVKDVTGDADPSASIIGTATLIVTAEPATAAPTIIIGGASGTPRAATPPPTNTGDGPSNGGPMPLFVMLVCLAFGGLGLLVVQVQRRAIRH
jgi:hypothetical protein